MSLDALKKAVRALEREEARLGALIAAQGAARTDLSSTELATLTTAFPDADRANDFLARLPSKPGAKAILAAFANPAELKALTEVTLGGDLRALGVLAETGCGGDAGKLKDFADKFAGNADFKVVMEKGGLGTRPEALAALLGDTCGGSADDLAKLVDTFKDPAQAANLEKALGKGGLGQAPDVLAELARGDDGALLKKLTDDFTSDDDLGKLNDLMVKGGLDGAAPGRAGLMKDVITKGLGGSPARLKELHAGFPSDADQAQFGRMILAFDGKDAHGGERLKAALDGFVHRGAADNADAAKKLRDPFMTNLEKMGRAHGTPDLGGDRASAIGDAAASGKQLSQAGVAAAMGDLLKPGAPLALGASDMALLLGDDAAQLALAKALLEGRADEIGQLPLPDANPAITQRTKEMTDTVVKDTAALVKLGAGAGDAACQALDQLADDLLTQARQEPDDATRTAALTAAKAAGAAIAKAVVARAAQALAGSGAIGATAAELGAVAEVRSGASDAEKQALTDLGKAAMGAAAAAAAAMGANADKTSAAAQALIGEMEADKQAAETKALNDKATSATAAALAGAAEIAKLPAPVNPAIVARVSAAATMATRAGAAAPDATLAQAAFDAARKAADAVAEAARRAAAASRAAAAFDSVKASVALGNGNSCDMISASLKAAGKATEALEAERAGDLARSVGVDIADLERVLANTGKADTFARAAAQAEVRDSVTFDEAALANLNEAKGANTDLTTAINVVNLIDETDAGWIDALTEMRAKAQALAMAARLVIDKDQRKIYIDRALDALEKARAGAMAYATAQQSVAATALSAKQKTASDDTTTERAALVADHMGGAATMGAGALAAQAEDLRAAMADRAGAMLSDALIADDAARALRDAATKADAEAQVPGASVLKRVQAAAALCAAAKGMADVAFTLATTHLGRVPAAPTGPVGTQLTTQANGMMPDTALRNAAAAFEAANAAAAKWHERANESLAEARTALAEVGTAHADHGDIDTAKTAAEGQIAAATAKQQELDPRDNTSLISQLNAIAKAWVTWINLNVLPANPAYASAQDMRNTYGTVAMMVTETKRGSGHVGAPRDELIRCAAGIKGDPDASGGTNSKQPCTITVAGTPPIAENGKVRQRHICGRHVAEAYEFGNVNDGGPRPGDVAAGHMMTAQFEGAPATLPPGQNLLKTLRKQSKAQKVNSFLPEEVTKANIVAVTEKVLSKARAGYGSSQEFQDAISDPPANGFLRATVSVDIPPVASIKVGFKLDGTTPYADMMHGTDVTMTMSDMMTIGRATGQ